MRRPVVSFTLAVIIAAQAGTVVGFAQAPAVCGDCNGDTSASIIDALLAAQHAAGLVALVDPSFQACNVAGTSGGTATAGASVDILDALGIARFAAGLGAALVCVPSGPQSPWETGSYFPPWQGIPPSRVVPLAYDPGQSAVANGARLADAILALVPGDRLEVGTGTYSINRWFNVDIAGTPSAPIWIVAAPGATPVMTRPDALQNVINLGAAGAHVSHVALVGFEITGGDTLVKVYSADNLWIDACHIHDGGGAGIAANSADTDHLYLTRNHIHDPGGTAEGMYLGANFGTVSMSYSIVALNHVHDTYGSQGDGIEIKQGSHHNWVAENEIHDCNYPCLILYGTDGNGVNLVERNVLYRSADNTLQIQGEAIVRNNLIIAGGTGFASTDHQGLTRDLVFVHNTILNTGRATNLTSWNGRAGMVFANNVAYSASAESLRFPSGSAGVIVSGNVVVGGVSGVAGGTVPGAGLGDFVGASYDGTLRDARPVSPGAIVGQGDAAHAVVDDLLGALRALPLDPGAFDAP